MARIPQRAKWGGCWQERAREVLSTTDSLFLSLFIRLVFRLRGVGICFDGYIHVSIWFQADLVATFIAQSILDPNLSIEFQQHLPNERLSSLQKNRASFQTASRPVPSIRRTVE